MLMIENLKMNKKNYKVLLNITKVVLYSKKDQRNEKF